jgi:hypothetical protein
MLILLRNKNLRAVNLLVAIVALIFFVLPVNVTTAATTKSELVQRISQDLGYSASSSVNSSGTVLGDQQSVPFFPRGFVYPIAELGNCDSKTSCYEFCEQQENLEFCAIVSYRNGTMNSSQLKKTLAFSHYMRAGYFENCNDLGSCASICEQKDSREDCDLLAMTLDQGIRVLGATDNTTTNNISIIDYCEKNPGCYNDEYSGMNNAVAVMDTLIKSGRAPSFCKTSEQCEEYCSMSSSSACVDLYNNIAYMSGTLTEDQTIGRVLDATTDNLSGQDFANVQMPTDPIAYRPQGVLSCIIDTQTEPLNEAKTGTEQTDIFMYNTQRCDRSYNATQRQVNSFANSGQSQTMSNVSNIYTCVLGLSSSSQIERCLNY